MNDEIEAYSDGEYATDAMLESGALTESEFVEVADQIVTPIQDKKDQIDIMDGKKTDGFHISGPNDWVNQ